MGLSYVSLPRDLFCHPYKLNGGRISEADQVSFGEEQGKVPEGGKPKVSGGALALIKKTNYMSAKRKIGIDLFLLYLTLFYNLQKIEILLWGCEK